MSDDPHILERSRKMTARLFDALIATIEREFTPDDATSAGILAATLMRTTVHVSKVLCGFSDSGITKLLVATLNNPGALIVPVAEKPDA